VTKGSEETWTVGEAATYLNAGGIDLGINAKAVRRAADNPDNQIRAVSGGGGRWRRVLRSTVRAERARLLRRAGVDDPEWPLPPEGDHSPAL
jgi:hypothetical protein